MKDEERNLGEGADIDDVAELTEEETLARLLEVEPGKAPEDAITLRRLGIKVTLEGLFGDKVSRIRKACTYRTKRDGHTVEALDEEKFNCALIAAATKSPNWGDQRLLEKYRASGPEAVLQRILLAGEQSALGDKVLELSGYNEDVETAKN
jgi:hypothetical protein